MKRLRLSVRSTSRWTPVGKTLRQTPRVSLAKAALVARPSLKVSHESRSNGLRPAPTT
ncbi:MAG: hypothetical protein JNK23_20715 [Opitutaceae bacterium]|nr:hypothetical protein [Opitutaceae bacterium]